MSALGDGYSLTLQTDGNLVLYRNNQDAIWASNTVGKGAVSADMQEDGNFVLYDSNGKPVWASNIRGYFGAYLQVQQDGNMVLHWGKEVIWASGTVDAPASPSRLREGEHLAPNQFRRSANQHYTLILQTDGNLVLYRDMKDALWASGTQGKPVTSAVMQGDGNLVLYDNPGTSYWASNTSGNPGSRLEVQDDGNVVIYSGSKAIWATNTVDIAASPARLRPGESLAPDESRHSNSGSCTLVLQASDGNLVLYNNSGKAVWASNTSGKPIVSAIMQSDGNFVLYDSQGKAVWASNTPQHSWSHLDVDDSCIAALYDSNNQPFWGTGPLWQLAH